MRSSPAVLVEGLISRLDHPHTENEERSGVPASVALNPCLSHSPHVPTPNPDILCLFKPLASASAIHLSLYFFCAPFSRPRRLPFLFGQLCSRGVPGILALDLLLNQQLVGSCLSLWSREPLLPACPHQSAPALLGQSVRFTTWHPLSVSVCTLLLGGREGRKEGGRAASPAPGLRKQA